MTDFDRQLSEALKRREPPRDLTASVMARIEPQRRATWSARLWVPIGIAAMLLLSIGVYRRWEEVQKGREAKRQVMVALELTTQKLAIAQKRVNELNHRRIGYE
jgi:hypothetical protein